MDPVWFIQDVTMTYAFIRVSFVDHIATITLNRPEKRNAMHGPLVKELLLALRQCAHADICVLIIQGNGENFCAGGDIVWMQKIAESSKDENDQDAQLLADMLFELYSFPKPTIVLAQGVTLGGGLGLLAAADIAIATKAATFGMPEVKIGITPSVISPYVISAIGERMAHYYFLTGERFGAAKAHEMRLIHQVTENDALMSTGLCLAKTLIQNSPKALEAVKQLVQFVSGMKINMNLSQKTAQHLAELRMTHEAQEGLRAFIEKRQPIWER